MAIGRFNTFEAHDTESDKHHGDNYMSKANLKKIAEQAKVILEMIEGGADIQEWAADHIATSADDIEEVYNYVKHRQEGGDKQLLSEQ